MNGSFTHNVFETVTAALVDCAICGSDDVSVLSDAEAEATHEFVRRGHSCVTRRDGALAQVVSCRDCGITYEVEG